MEELKPLGKAISEAITIIYIYGAILAAVVIALTTLIIVYMNKKKKLKNENDEKKYLPMKISIYVAAGVLVLLVSPMIIIHFL